MTYLCPKCKSIMQCVSTASIPPITRYECFSCGYSSKPVRENLNGITLPPWLRDDDDIDGTEKGIYKPEIIKLIEQYPDLPIVPMVDSEVVADDSYSTWMGKWGSCYVTEYYLGRERVHFKDYDDEEEVLDDMVGCRYGYDLQGRDIYELSDEEWDKLYQSIPWIKCIAVDITV